MGYVVCPGQYMMFYEEPLVVRAAIWLAYQAFKLVPKKMVFGEELSGKAQQRMVCGPN